MKYCLGSFCPILFIRRIEMNSFRNYVLSFLLAIVFSVSCQNTEKSILTDNPVADPQLSSAVDDDLVLLSTKDGDSPLVEKWVKLVTWDGKSPLEMKMGVVYKFNSIEEIRNALRITGNGHLACFDDMLRRRAEKSGKMKSSAELASSSSTSVTWFEGSKLCGKGECTTTAGWSGTLRHYICIEWNFGGGPQFAYGGGTWTDGAYHQSSLTRKKDCPVAMWVDADIYLNENPVYDSHDEDICN